LHIISFFLLNQSQMLVVPFERMKGRPIGAPPPGSQQSRAGGQKQMKGQILLEG
jgi:hypothetical protein